MSKFCYNCGKELTDDAKECPNCGKQTNYAVEKQAKNETSSQIDPNAKTYSIVSLVCGICSIVFCSIHWLISLLSIISGVVAVICSVKAKKTSSNGMATAGLVCGIIGIVLSSFGFLITSCLSCAGCVTHGIGDIIRG